MSNLPIVSPTDPEARITFWTTHIENWQSSGLTQAAYVEQHQLSLARFGYWKRKLASPPTDAFVQVHLEQPAQVRIHHRSGMVIECQPGTDVRWLRQLLEVNHAS